MTDRSERALRAALSELPPDEPLDTGAVRRRAADRRQGGRVAMGVAVALVLVAGVIGVPRLLPTTDLAEPTAARGAGPGADAREPEAVPADSSGEPAPDGWRTEYYRDISFEVPADWGYAMPPDSSWCANSPDGQPLPERLEPYVWLDTNHAVRAIGCGPQPDTLLTEHVVALEPGPAVDYVEGSYQTAGWWVVTRFTGSAILVVTTKDRDRAERILDSSTVVGEDAPCPPSSPVAGPLGTRPAEPTDLTALGTVDQVVLCQYEADPEPDAGRPRLRAARLVTGQSADQLVGDLQAAPVNDTTCDPPPVDGLPNIAMLVRVRTDGSAHDVYVSATGCPASASGMAGGIDDGTTLRLLTREACRSLLTPPIALYTGSGAVGRNCLG